MTKDTKFGNFLLGLPFVIFVSFVVKFLFRTLRSLRTLREKIPNHFAISFTKSVIAVRSHTAGPHRRT